MLFIYGLNRRGGGELQPVPATFRWEAGTQEKAPGVLGFTEHIFTQISPHTHPGSEDMAENSITI